MQGIKIKFAKPLKDPQAATEKYINAKYDMSIKEFLKMLLSEPHMVEELQRR